MRPITVSVGPLTASSTISSGQPQPANTQMSLGQTPTGGSNVAGWTGSVVIVNGVCTPTTTTGVFGGGMRLMGIGILANTKVVGPGPTPGTWIVSPTQTISKAARGNCVVTLDAPRQLTITNTEPAGTSFTVQGTDAAGNQISETLATNGAALTTSQSFSTVTQCYIGAVQASAAVTLATAASASAQVAFDPYTDVASITKQAVVSGAATFSVQISNDDPNAPGGLPPGGMTWSNDPDATFVGATANVEGSWAFVPLWARLLLTAGAGSVRATFAQAG